MATAEKSKRVLNVGALKKFLEDIPDKTPIRGNFDDRMQAIIWKSDSDEIGPRKWFALEDV